MKKRNLLAPILFFIVLLTACISPRQMARYMAMRDSEDNTKQVNLEPIRVSAKTWQVPDKQIDILHMDLDVRFVMSQHEALGKVSLLLKPFFYKTDSIVLDAKEMVFSNITLTDQQGKTIQHQVVYNKEKLKLFLERKITADDTLTLAIAYVARPDEVNGAKGKAIRDDNGLYFINTDHSEPYQPMQIWTQGETECNSAWFPTIEHPNEKFTSKLTIHADKDFTILSNGIRRSSQIEGNTKTEVWENTKPMPAYLLMMAIGNFSVTHDMAERIPVDYYLEDAYSSLAKQIFQHTPEMIDFFGAKLGVPYPWDKYSQVVVRDYVSGAMENTSATLHGEFVQKNERELEDGSNDGIIAHELFHQWFGDLVTCKSWTHLVLNEGFATYGEQLWQEYKYGNDAALREAQTSLDKYISHYKNNGAFPIVRNNYKNPDDMFTSVTYQKGARVINLLRLELGDIAFFKGLKLYLSKYAYGNADIDDLRKEFELVSGKDLQPFFKQWFLEEGHPVIQLRYNYIDSLKTIAVNVEQTQSGGVFKFPLQFKIKDGNLFKEYTFPIERRKEVFYVKKINTLTETFPNVIVDPNGYFIGELNDSKPLLYTIETYTSEANYLEKYRSLKSLSAIQSESDTARKVLLSAMNDRFPEIRAKAIQWLRWDNVKTWQEGLSLLTLLSQSDPNAAVRFAATQVLADKKDPTLLNHLSDKTQDKSYKVAAAALHGLYNLLPDEALRIIPDLKKDARGNLLREISEIYSKTKDSSCVAFYYDQLPRVFNYQRKAMIDDYVNLVQGINRIETTQAAVDYLETKSLKDKYPIVRFGAMNGMHTLKTGIQNTLNITKDVEIKSILSTMVNAIQEKLNKVIQQEEDESVLSMLKNQGIEVVEKTP